MPLTIIHGDSEGADQLLCQLTNRYTQLSSTLHDGLLNPEQLEFMKKIRHDCAKISNKILLRTIKSTFIYKAIIPTLVQFNQEYFTTHQVELALHIIKSSTKTKKFYTQSSDLADLHSSKIQEFSSVKTSTDSIVCVQAGSVLESARALHLLGKAKKIICLEESYEKVLLGKHILTRLGLDTIELIHCTGDIFDYKHVDLVYIPNIVNNKDQILQQIYETHNKKPIVLSQYATGLSTLFYNNYTPNILNKFFLESRINCSRVFSNRELHTLKMY